MQIVLSSMSTLSSLSSPVSMTHAMHTRPIMPPLMPSSASRPAVPQPLIVPDDAVRGGGAPLAGGGVAVSDTSCGAAGGSAGRRVLGGRCSQVGEGA
jgi:hypothetical protein